MCIVKPELKVVVDAFESHEEDSFHESLGVYVTIRMGV
jgi:hypothetical protein